MLDEADRVNTQKKARLCGKKKWEGRRESRERKKEGKRENGRDEGVCGRCGGSGGSVGVGVALWTLAILSLSLALAGGACPRPVPTFPGQSPLVRTQERAGTGQHT